MSPKECECFSIKKIDRESNMELLRIVAMFFVVMLHTTFLSTGIPNADDFSLDFAKTLTRVSVSGVTVVCVNLFVLISGWYGIRPKRTKFAELLFQLVFFITVCLVYGYVRKGHLVLDEILRTFRLHNMWWFVKSYILLYFLTPVLNAFCERASKKEFAVVLIAFYGFSSLNWLIHSVNWMENGYSTMSFIGLYLLARFVKLHLSDFISIIQKRWLLLVYILFSSLTVLGFYIETVYHKTPINGFDFFDYDSPFVVMASISLLLFFSGIKIKSKMVNWVAKSCFAVYLLHMGNYIFPDFKSLLGEFYSTHVYWMYLCYSIFFSLTVFAIGIILDKIRIRLWNLVIEK